MAAVPLIRDINPAAVTSSDNIPFSVSTHVTNALTTVAIRHVGVQTNKQTNKHCIKSSWYEESRDGSVLIRGLPR